MFLFTDQAEWLAHRQTLNSFRKLLTLLYGATQHAAQTVANSIFTGYIHIPLCDVCSQTGPEDYQRRHCRHHRSVMCVPIGLGENKTAKPAGWTEG